MNALTNIPPGVRTALYLIGWFAGTTAAGITVVWAAIAAASPDVSMPLWLVIVSASAGFIGSQFNLLASANTPSYADVVEGEAAPPPRERGAVDALTVLVIVVVILVFLLLLGYLPHR